MSLSRFLQSPDFLGEIGGKGPERLRQMVLAKGEEWFRIHPGELDVIKRNCEKLGMRYTEDLLNRICRNVILHYFEKFMPLCADAGNFKTFLSKRVADNGSSGQLRFSLQSNKGVLIAVSHFGAVEFLVPTLAASGFKLNAVLRFTTAELSDIAHARVKEMEKGGFGPVNFIEIGKPGTTAALDMAAVLRRREILVSVFDEKTEYSKKVKLFNAEVYGGAGLDRLLSFANAPVDIYTAYVLRRENDSYDMNLYQIGNSGNDPIRELYSHLESMVNSAPEQWYFLHEEIPFVE